jgi:hypothetical protein
MTTRRQGLTPPRIGTPRSSAKSLGPFAAQVATGLGVEWWPWQKYVTDTAMELRRRRGKNGLARFQAAHVGILVPRQCGKSIVARVRGWTQCLLPDLDGVADLVGGRVGPQHVGWLCQDRANAIRAWTDAVDMLMSSDYAEAVQRVKMQRGDECVTFRNGSWLRVVTPSRTGPRGLDCDLILLDEALAHDVSLLAALAPTQAQRDQASKSLGAQLVALSSEGDERSTLLATMAEQGRRAVAERDRSRAWFEWSAPPDADVYDPEVWRAAIPTLDRPAGISTDFVRLQSETMDLDDFRREYLCLHTPRPAQQVIDLDRWEDSPHGQPERNVPVVFGVDVTPSGSAASLVAVATADRGHALELVRTAGGVDWLTAATVDIAKRWNAPVVLDGTGPAAWLAPALEQAEVEVIRIKAGDVYAAASRFAVLVDEGRIAHQHDPRLSAAVAAATRRRSGDRWGFDRHAADVSALVAAALAVWAIETTSVVQSQVW